MKTNKNSIDRRNAKEVANDPSSARCNAASLKRKRGDTQKQEKQHNLRVNSFKDTVTALVLCAFSGCFPRGYTLVKNSSPAGLDRSNPGFLRRFPSNLE